MNSYFHPTTHAKLAQLTSHQLQVHILYGPKYIGKFAAAKELAAKIIGDEKIADIHSSANRNLFVLEPQDKKAVSIEQIRQLITQLHATSHNHKSKVVIVKNIDEISEAGQNAMLKVLEESPTQAYFFLLAQNLNSILPTIRSRATHTYFQTPTTPELAEFLVRQHSISELEAKELTTLAHNLPMRVIDLVENKAGEDLKVVHTLAQDFLTGDTSTRILIAKNIADQNLTHQFLSELNYAIGQESSILQKATWFDVVVEAEAKITANANDRVSLEVVALKLEGENK